MSAPERPDSLFADMQRVDQEKNRNNLAFQLKKNGFVGVNTKKAKDLETSSTDLKVSKPAFNKIDTHAGIKTSSGIELMSCCDIIFLRIDDESGNKLHYSIASHQPFAKYLFIQFSHFFIVYYINSYMLQQVLYRM